MSVFTICRQVVPQGELEAYLRDQAEAEASFNDELGVLQRHFYQCLQQPHVIWANTEWKTQKAHDDAAEGLMKVRRDDRVASAYFRPGLYFEVFARPLKEASARFGDGETGLVVTCHGLVADRSFEGWRERLADRLAAFSAPAGLHRLSTYENHASRREFVAFFEWKDDESYGRGRMVGEETVEETLLVGGRPSELAAYVQYECAPLLAELRTAP